MNNLKWKSDMYPFQPLHEEPNKQWRERGIEREKKIATSAKTLFPFIHFLLEKFMQMLGLVSIYVRLLN